MTLTLPLVKITGTWERGGQTARGGGRARRRWATVGLGGVMAPPKTPMTSFTVSRKKRTPFQKAKDEEELKRKRDAEDAARLLKDFDAEFAKGDGKRGRVTTFVSAGVQNAGSRPGDDIDDARRGSTYALGAFEPEVATASADRAERSSGTSEAAPGTSKSGGKPRAIDALMGEMKAKQEERERARREGRDFDEGLSNRDSRRKGSRAGVDDAHSTNLFVGNLPVDADEDSVMREFAKYGPIASVKIMWPREDELMHARALSGFVAFMTRSSAEQAKEEMDGKVLGGTHDLRVGWGKPVPLPAKPIWPLTEEAHGSDEYDHERRSSARGFSTKSVRAREAPPPAPPPPKGTPEMIVTFPADERVVAIVDTLARYVAEDGRAFERAVMDRERDNEDFAFLFDHARPEHAYYRWRVFSLAQGDSLTRWRTDPFVMIEGGLRWTPPDPALRPDTTAPPSIAIAGLPADETRLGEADAEAFANALRSLTISRADIEAGMLFALDHASAAQDVAEMLTESLTLAETPVAAKVARLFLVSDILHNSGAPVKHAAAYRRAFQDHLPRVFESLRGTLRDMSSRIAREALKKRVGAVLAAWSDWFLFQDEFLRGLEATFALGAASAADALPTEEIEKLRAKYGAMREEDLERACRTRGLVADEGPQACVERLVELDAHERTETTPASANLHGGKE